MTKRVVVFGGGFEVFLAFQLEIIWFVWRMVPMFLLSAFNIGILTIYFSVRLQCRVQSLV